jgi:hypothetical protein
MNNGHWDQWRHFDSLLIVFRDSHSFFFLMVNYVSLFSVEDNMLPGSWQSRVTGSCEHSNEFGVRKMRGLSSPSTDLLASQE